MAGERGAQGRRGGFTPLTVVGSAAMDGAPLSHSTSGGPEATGSPADEAAEVAVLGERVGELIDALGSHDDPAVGDQVDELLDAIDHLHREALMRLAGLLTHHDLLAHACDDPLVGAVFDLYDLRPEASDEQPASPLISTPPLVSSPRPAVSIAASPPGLIPLNVATPLQAPPAAPAMTPIEGVKPVTNASPVAVPEPGLAEAAGADGGEWFDVCSVEEVAPGSVFAPDEGALLLANVGDEILAYRNGCGNGPLALHMGRMADETHLVCPWHIGCVYDLTVGVSGELPEQLTLIRYPVRIEDGRIHVAFHHGAPPSPPRPAAPASASA